ncbi:rab GTPase-binding effector protein 1 isoform X1 [Helicoverpa zea]|uniref:rab GTPase-binding effector protein 1 isoform X1 n=1 Tax=Helicoverpa zea TaxID=7113 RepID=UPI001F566CF3|nr:rab GTPase-binding effector protein 1 isoform X1 [Helicoverpa zea]XP_047030100.1 rab GTPase-binding effector protein 1 isoform X1 [Helicoverpa zea]
MDSQSTMSSENTDGPKVEAAGECNGPAADQTRRLLEEEFNVQRAKMKELFLQKEEDMRKMLQDKEQLESEVLGLRAELQQLQTLSENQKSEIQSLQMLVSETVEASSSGTEEVRRLRARNLELEQHLNQMRQQQQEVSLAPATFVRSLARKLTAETEDQPPKKNLEEELLRSIIQPLEMEIAALKTKLRDTDAQLQDALAKAKSTAAAAASGDAKTENAEASRQCDMCANYEKQLVLEQANAEQARDKALMKELALKQATEELEGVRSLHDETVRSWHSERQASAEQLDSLQAAVDAARAALEQQAAAAEQASQRALQHVTELTVDRETLQKKLDSLERDNAMLMGQYTKKAADMQNEIIDLPDNVEELQELTLRLREQLILCEIGREEARGAERELRAQLLQHGALFHRQDAELTALRNSLKEAKEEIDRLQTEQAAMQELGSRLRQAGELGSTLLEDKRRLQAELLELRGRVSVLQQELDNSEKVQQDFVRLSQSLQVQLQRIREADTEVRWQHEDDVHECPACHAHLPNPKKKVHCRHCGRIFCSACVSCSVPAGPRRVPARVCAVCRTLLQPHAAPYFSTEPPRSPD